MNKIVEFQQKNALVADGVIGKKTLLAIKGKLKIESDEQLAHFMGQCAVESALFTADTENLNYSESGLLTIFHKYFPTQESTVGYSRNPVKIANRVYANRGGNGSESSGMGYLYRGRGAIQLTFAGNYKAFSEFVGNSQIMTRPELVAEIYYFESALFYFNNNHLFRLCAAVTDASIGKVSRAVNCGNADSKTIPHGLKERILYTKKYYSILKA